MIDGLDHEAAAAAGEAAPSSDETAAARQEHPVVMTREEMLRFLDFLEEAAAEAGQVLPAHRPDPHQRIMVHLMRSYLEARMTTITTLALASGAPYATAMRRIEELIEQGFILRRAKTRTGKSFSLHPSHGLIDAWFDYARRMKQVIGKTVGLGEETSDANYYFGSSYLSARIIPMPVVLKQPLALASPLRMLVHADPTFLAMDTLKRQFEQILGTRIQNRALSIDRLRLEALRNAEMPLSEYDIIASDLPWIGEFAAKGVLADLDEFIEQGRFNRSDFYPAAWRSCIFNGHQYGIPVQTTPELLFYRTDLFEEAGLEGPETTDEVIEAARVLHKPRSGIRGIAWNAARGTPLGHTFIMNMADFGRPVLALREANGTYDASDLTGERLRPCIDTPAGRGAAEYLRNLLDYSPANILSMSWYERVAAYGRGEVAMAYSYTSLAPYFELNPKSTAHGRSGFLPHPRGQGDRNIAPVGGYALGIPRNIAAERLPAVRQALQVLTSAEACKLYALNGSLTCPRFSAGGDPEVRSISPVIPAVDGMARSGVLQYWPRPPAPEIAQVIAVCGEEMHDMLRGFKTVDRALSTAQNRVDAIMRANGHY